MTLNEIIEIEREIEKAGNSPETYYGQFTTRSKTQASRITYVHMVKTETTVKHLDKTIHVHSKEGMTAEAHFHEVNSGV